MIEPTETENKRRSTRLRGAAGDRPRGGRRTAGAPDAPHTRRSRRLDEAAAAERLLVRYGFADHPTSE